MTPQPTRSASSPRSPSGTNKMWGMESVLACAEERELEKEVGHSEEAFTLGWLNTICTCGMEGKGMAATAEKQELSAAMCQCSREETSHIYFVHLGQKNLTFEKRVYAFTCPRDPTKHFKRKHLSQIKKDKSIEPYATVAVINIEVQPLSFLLYIPV